MTPTPCAGYDKGPPEAGLDGVEMAGIEPASSRGEPGLLRAQPVWRFARPLRSHRRVATRPSLMGVPRDPSDESHAVSLLDEANDRTEGTPGLTLR